MAATEMRRTVRPRIHFIAVCHMEHNGKMGAALLQNYECVIQSCCSAPRAAGVRNLKMATARRKTVFNCLLFQKMRRLSLKI